MLSAKTERSLATLMLLSKVKRKEKYSILFFQTIFNNSTGTKSLVHLHGRAVSTRAKAFTSLTVGESPVPPYNVNPDS